MRNLVIAAALVLAVPVSAGANTFRAVNYLTVVPLGNTTFEVIEERGAGARGIWCAAAEYAERRLGARGRMYISEGRAASRSVAGRKSVIFTTDVSSLSQQPSTGISLSTSDVGRNLPIAHAIQFCRTGDSRHSKRFSRGF